VLASAGEVVGTVSLTVSLQDKHGVSIPAFGGEQLHIQTLKIFVVIKEHTSRVS